MSYALRTTLILGGFWLLVFLVGLYQVNFRMAGKEEELLKKEQIVREELELNETLVASLPAIQEELDQSISDWENRKKLIPRHETSHGTYRYIDQILSRQKTTLDFDYMAKDVRDSAGVLYSDYEISGEARFIDLYRFIWYIEHLPRYLKLNSMELLETRIEGRESATKEKWVKFNIDLTALSADREGFDEIEYAVDINPTVKRHDPFSPPRKSKPKIPPNTRGLPNVFSSTLRALTPTQAYLIDQNGELKILALGDEVYLGKLIDIIPDKNEAVFDLRQIYPPRRVSLVVDTGK